LFHFLKFYYASTKDQSSLSTEEKSKLIDLSLEIQKKSKRMSQYQESKTTKKARTEETKDSNSRLAEFAQIGNFLD
jgi:hypothetical protein